MMELSLLNKEYRNTLYFKKYKYRVMIWLNSMQSNRNDALNYLYSIKNTHSSEISVRVELTYAFIYSNNLDLLINLSKNFDCEFYEAIADAPKGVLLFKNKPKHKYRVFLKKGLHKNIKNTLLELHDRYKNSNTKLIYSNGLTRWLSKKYNYGYMYSTYYIDYDHESTQILLALYIGEILDKTFKLEQRP